MDNASNDGTRHVAEMHGARVVEERERRIEKVRNTATTAARVPFLLFVDADTLDSGEHLAAALEALLPARRMAALP